MPSQQWNTKKVIYLSMLVALQIILSRVFSINAWNIRIGFGFIPMIFAILYFGTKEGVLVAVLSDLLGGLFLSSYPYFPGYTLSLALSAYLFSLAIRKKRTRGTILFGVILTQLICSLFLNSLWIAINSGSPLLPIMLTRLIQIFINGSMQFFTIQFMVYILENRLSLQEYKS